MYASDYRRIARENLSGNWKTAILVTFVSALLGGLVASGGFSIDIDESILEDLPPIVIQYLTISASIGTILSIIRFIIGGTVRLGYCQYLLKLHNGEEGELKDLFSQFYRFSDGFCLALLESLYIFLWTLLFIIPGIIATYRYAMAPYIMLENPGMGANEALKTSSSLMDGNKWRLFCLQFSFIGWAFLNIFTLGIGSLWLNPYMNVAHAAFYRDLTP